MPHEIFELRTRVRDLRRKAACVKTQQRGDIPRFKRPQNHLRQIESILPMSIGRQTIVLPVSDSREALRADPASHTDRKSPYCAPPTPTPCLDVLPCGCTTTPL